MGVLVFVTGDLLLVNVENKDVAFSKKTKNVVTSLVWVQQEKPQKKDTIDSVLLEVIKILLLNTLCGCYLLSGLLSTCILPTG